jgi:hypothetical protein
MSTSSQSEKIDLFAFHRMFSRPRSKGNLELWSRKRFLAIRKFILHAK